MGVTTRAKESVAIVGSVTNEVLYHLRRGGGGERGEGEGGGRDKKARE